MKKEIDSDRTYLIVDFSELKIIEIWKFEFSLGELKIYKN